MVVAADKRETLRTLVTGYGGPFMVAIADYWQTLAAMVSDSRGAYVTMV